MPQRYRVELNEQARRELAALPKDAQARIRAKVQALADDPRPPGSKKMEGEDNLYRIRVGVYRVLYRVHDDVLLVLVVKIGHRGDVYRRRGGKRRRG